jgi:hypothetical protein
MFERLERNVREFSAEVMRDAPWSALFIMVLFAVLVIVVVRAQRPESLEVQRLDNAYVGVIHVAPDDVVVNAIIQFSNEGDGLILVTYQDESLNDVVRTYSTTSNGMPISLISEILLFKDGVAVPVGRLCIPHPTWNINGRESRPSRPRLFCFFSLFALN